MTEKCRLCGREATRIIVFELSLDFNTGQPVEIPLCEQCLRQQDIQVEVTEGAT